MESREVIRGNLAPVFSPMSPDGKTILYDLIPQYAQDLVQQRIDGIYLCGTSGESFSLTIQERKLLMEAWMNTSEVKNCQLKVLPHIGDHSFQNTVELAKHAQQHGAKYVALMAPSYYKPKTEQELADVISAVANEVPDISVYYYHIPSMNGLTQFTPKLFQLVKEKAPNFVGCKFTSGNLPEASKNLELGFEVLLGADDIYYLGRIVGVHGLIGITANLIGESFAEIVNAINKNDIPAAQIPQARINKFLDLLNTQGKFIQGAKYLMKTMRGIDCGQVRWPMPKLTPEECQNLDKLALEFKNQ